MQGLATKRDYLLVSIIGVLFGLFAIPILENIRPAFWHLSASSVIFLLAGFALFANLALGIAGLIGARYPGIFQFAKYAATGALNSFTDLGLFNLLSMIFQIFSGSLIVVFNVISFSVAVTNSYFWNRLWVFRKAGAAPLIGSYAKFIGVTLSGAAINSAIVYVITTTIGAPLDVTPELWENVAKLIGVPVSIIWNFFGYKFFVFK